MIARPRERRSPLAYWSWRLGLLAVLALVAGTAAHRLASIGTPAFYVVLGVALSLAVTALFCAITALEQIWRDGRRGLGAAIRGLFLASALLVLPAHAAWQIVTLPRLADISTDPARPPPLTASAGVARPAGAPDAAQQLKAYPDILPRRYPVEPRRVFEEARKLVVARGWDVLDLAAPAPPRQTGAIGALAKTFPLAFRQDVALRFEPDGTGTRVDMRSASRFVAHDLGSNADLVRRFLTDLDGAISALAAPG